MNNKILKLSFSLAVLLGSQASFADGTPANTLISNTATLSYSVGGAPQADIATDTPATFRVDNKVDLSVAGDKAVGVYYPVGPSSSRSTATNKLSYTLKNEGNKLQKFEISVSHLTSDNFNAGEIPTGGSASPQAAEICQFTITPLSTGVTSAPVNIGTVDYVTLGIDAADETAKIDVMCSMPNRPGVDINDGDLSTIDVLATAVDASNAVMAESASDAPLTVDVVLADNVGSATDAAVTGFAGVAGDRNAKHSDTQTFEIETPILSISKTSKVISDPFNDVTNPKRIPGAVIEYTITIENDSDNPITVSAVPPISPGVTVTDVLTAVIAEEVVFNSVTNAAGGTVVYDLPSATLTVTGIAVPAAVGGTAGTVAVTFEVTIL